MLFILREGGRTVKDNKWFLYCSIIGVAFWWTGTAYMSSVYRLLRFYTPSQVDVFAMVTYYIMQVLGLAAYSLLMRSHRKQAVSRKFFVLLVLSEAAVVPIALHADSPVVLLVAGHVMNLLHGAVAGYYLMQLSCLVPGMHRGKTFGIGYAIGSIGSWLVSLPDRGEFLQSDSVVWVYWLLMGISLVLLRFAGEPRLDHESVAQEPTRSSGSVRIPEPTPGERLWADRSLWLNIAIAIILLTTARTVGFSFPAADISSVVNLELSRAWYALGLVTAGLINDRSRREGAACALVALVFPFIAITLKSEPSLAAIMWALGYVFFGFMAVHRVLSFADIAGSLPSLLPLAGLGLLAGRIGDILGTVGALLCGDNAIILVTVTAAAAILAILVFLKIYQRLYMPAPTGEQVDQLRLRRFESQHGLSIREREVFRLLISGSTNQEIAGRLFVSESTVKFHVTNILRKTGCRSRNEVLALCDSFPAHLE